MGTILLAIPPEEEQGRILAAIQSIESYIDEYGALEDARESLDTALPDRLRKSVLQQAVQGRLVPQDPNDEPASALLERIREERRELVAAGKAKPPKDGESVIYRGSDGGYYEKRGKDDAQPIEVPYDVPDSWEWTRFGSLIELTSGVDLASSEYNDKNKGIPYLTGASNFENGDLIENRWTEAPKRISHKGDLLFTCKGTIGEMAINRFDKAHIARQIMAIAPYDEDCLEYIELFLSSMVEAVKKEAHGVIPGIERKTLLEALFPMPPIQEQRRINDIVRRSISLLS